MLEAYWSTICFQDYIIPKTDKSARKKLFGECEKLAEAINPAVNQAQSENYYYLKLSCSAFYAESGSIMEKMSRLPLFKRGGKDLLGAAINTGVDEYFGGGIYRTAAGVLSNPQAKLVGCYKPEEALENVETAMAVYSDDQELTGEDYCENHRYLMQALLAQKPMTAEAKEAGEYAIEYFGATRNSNGDIVDYTADLLDVETPLCIKEYSCFLILSNQS